MNIYDTKIIIFKINGIVGNKFEKEILIYIFEEVLYLCEMFLLKLFWLSTVFF